MSDRDETKGEAAERARRDKENDSRRARHERRAGMTPSTIYRIYRRAGLRPWCAVRFLIKDRFA